VYRCSFGCFHIGIEQNLASNIQEKVLKHELIHIKKHCPQTSYIIGLDMQHTKLEKEASIILSKDVGI
jgi:hypothetical protein